MVSFLPLADRLKLSQRILRLAAFCERSTQLLNQRGVQPPLDTLALVIFFVVASYIPALVTTMIYTLTCKKSESPRFDPNMHVYNKPDALELTRIMQTVTKIQESVT